MIFFFLENYYSLRLNNLSAFYISMNIGKVTELIFHIQCWIDFFFLKRFWYHTEQYSWFSVKLLIWFFLFCCVCLFVCLLVYSFNKLHIKLVSIRSLQSCMYKGFFIFVPVLWRKCKEKSWQKSYFDFWIYSEYIFI